MNKAELAARWGSVGESVLSRFGDVLPTDVFVPPPEGAYENILLARVFPRADRLRRQCDGVAVCDDVAGFEPIDDAALFDAAQAALAHSKIAQAVLAQMNGDFTVADVPDASWFSSLFGSEILHQDVDCFTEGTHLYAETGTDGRVYAFALVDATDSFCSMIQGFVSDLRDAPSLLDAVATGWPNRAVVAKRFVLDRSTDPTGVSGTGIVADGEVLADGRAVVQWRGPWPTTTIHPSLASVEAIHLHGGATKIVWL